MSGIFQRGISWHTYLNLEKDFIDVTRYVALDRNHGGVWSEKIAQLLLLTGSTVDSVFNEMRMSSFLEQFKSVIDLRQKREPNIGDYREVYDPIYQLSSVELRAQYGLADYGIISPFQPFAPKNSPKWWIAYNDIKHEFFQNISEGTLDNLIHALGALYFECAAQRQPTISRDDWRDTCRLFRQKDEHSVYWIRYLELLEGLFRRSLGRYDS